MKKKICYNIIFLCCFISCVEENKMQKNEYVVINTVDNFGDSVFFSQVNYMQLYKDKLFFNDNYASQIFSLNKDLSLNRIIGQRGEGPNEFNYMGPLNVLDNIICQFSGGGYGFLYYYDLSGNIIEKHEISQQEYKFMPSCRFVITPFHMFVSSTHRGPSDYGEVSLKTDIQYPFGEIENKKIVGFSRHILKWNNQYVCVSDNIPIIEFFDPESKQKIKTYDYSDVPEVKKSLGYIERQPTAPKSYYMINSDACIYNDKLYILLMQHGDETGFSVNKILEIELTPIIQTTNIFELPGNIYNTFCMSGDSIYAFNHINSQIEILIKKGL